MLWPLILFSCVVEGLDPTPSDINRLCYTCSVYSSAGRMRCENPGVCYSDHCYSYVVDDGTTLFLSGCAEDITDFPVRGSNTLCHASSGVGLCVCATDREACNLLEDVANSSTTRNVRWIDSELGIMENISLRVTGFSVKYAKHRVDQLKLDGLEKAPRHFNSTRLSQKGRAVKIPIAVILLSLLLI